LHHTRIADCREVPTEQAIGHAFARGGGNGIGAKRLWGYPGSLAKSTNSSGGIHPARAFAIRDLLTRRESILGQSASPLFICEWS
jgi:hypothetical protein